MTKTVFISGAGGYIASHIVDQLLTKGYAVVGSVQTAEEGNQKLSNYQKKFQKPIKLEYTVVADIAEPNCFDEVFIKYPHIEYVLHTVSPISFDTGKSIEDAFVTPAVTGTISLLKAVAKYGHKVRKVIHTSSLGAIFNTASRSKGKIHTEDTWNRITLPMAEKVELKLAGTILSGVVGYSASKTFAEKLAWQFMEENKPGFTLTVINPPMVYGPQLFDDTVSRLNSSLKGITVLLKTKTPRDDDKNYSFGNLSLDVRDSAKVHVMAIEKDLGGQRILVTNGKFCQQRILDILNDKFPFLGLAKGDPSKVEEYEKAVLDYDNSRSMALLGPMDLISFEQSVFDTVDQIVRVRGSKL